MAAGNTKVLKAMNVIFWIIFIGLCIKTGTILYSYFVSMVINPVASHNLYMGLNLSDLFNYNITHYSIIVFMLIILTGLKAYIGYWIVKISLELRMEKPFSEVINSIIAKIGRIALYAGLLAIIAQAYSEWLMKKDIAVPIHWAYAEILFFAGIIYFISEVYKKGTEIQAESELTV